MAGQHRFAAFISYSSADGAFAKRLHRALECYRVPGGAGSFNLAGKPNRVAPVFLDRAELSSGELGSAISGAIEMSSAMIVVCSPRAVQSEWVDKEIRHFIQTGRVRRIFAIIASGEPFASAHGALENECFPLALRELARGQFGDAYEVVAGDARPGKDGFRNAWLKVAAGILDVGFGKLLDRDAAARRTRTMFTASAAAVIAAVVGTLTTFWYLESQRYQNEARSSLMREARNAFELDDNPRAITALAHLLPTMSVEDRAAYQRVLDAWSGRFPHFAASLADTPAVFAYDDRVFLKTPEGIVATPLPADAVIASSSTEQTVLGIDFSGRVWRWRPGEAAAEDLKLPSGVLARHDWQSAMKLRAGGAVFGGAVQASYAGGADPVLLFVNDASHSHAIVPLSYSELESLRLAKDCTAVAFRVGRLDMPWDDPEERSGLELKDGFYQLNLQSPSAKVEPVTAEIYGAVPSLEVDLDNDQGGFVRIAFDAIAAACGDGRVAQGTPPRLNATLGAAQDDALPEEEAPEIDGNWAWVSRDTWIDEITAGDSGAARPELARIVELTDAIQRAQVQIGDITRIRDGVADTVVPEDEIAFETVEGE